MKGGKCYIDRRTDVGDFKSRNSNYLFIHFVSSWYINSRNISLECSWKHHWYAPFIPFIINENCKSGVDRKGSIIIN